MRVCSGLVIADMFVGFFNRRMMDRDTKDPRIVDATATNINGNKSESCIFIVAATAIAMVRLTKKYGSSPMIRPMKYIGRVMGEATFES